LYHSYDRSNGSALWLGQVAWSLNPRTDAFNAELQLFVDLEIFTP